MGVISVKIAPDEIARSETFRLDAKIHANHYQIATNLADIQSPLRFGELAEFSNGPNLPKAAYADPEDQVVARYLSVRGLANYVFDPITCNDLRSVTSTAFLSPEDDQAQSRLVAQTNEVLITRSRATAPGITMSGAEIDSSLPVVPSGFVIRAQLEASLHPTYITAILNHPVWRTFTAGLAAGKSQDNLSQELLAQIPIPPANTATQALIVERYRRFLSEALDIQRSDSRFEDACNAIIQQATGLTFEPAPKVRVRSRAISAIEIADSRTLRLDNRWHGSALRKVRSDIETAPFVRFDQLITALDKNSQPKWVIEDSSGSVAFHGAATSSIRFGQVVAELLKPTTAESVAAFSVINGDLLMAMDGDGSIGKAAVVESDTPFTIDSHLSRIRLRGGRETAQAVSCLLNSSWGLTQSNGLMSGATGQTQLSITDVRDMLIPQAVLDNAVAIATLHHELTDGYVAPGPQVRDLLCAASADIAQILVAAGAILPSGDSSQWSAARMRTLLGRIYTSSK